MTNDSKSPATPQQVMERMKENLALYERNKHMSDGKSFVPIIQNFPTVVASYEALYRDACVMFKTLKRIEDMNCIQHMPSCSDIAINCLGSLSNSYDH